MAWCLVAQNHYLNQWWPIINTGFCGIHLWTISQKVLIILIHNMCSMITLSKLRPHSPGNNELKHSIGWYMTEARQHCSLSSLICPCLCKWSPDGMDPTQYICYIYIYIYCCFSTEFAEHIAAWWCIYTFIGSWYGQLLIQRQDITITNANFPRN